MTQPAACKKKPASKMRKSYILKLIVRCVILLASVAAYIVRPQWFGILEGDRFFRELSPLHILWVVWMIDMILQLIPMKNHIPLGSHKHQSRRFRPTDKPLDHEAMMRYIRTATKGAYKVFIIWSAALVVLGILYAFRILKTEHLFLISVAFYVCDLICVLIWCPFRLMMKTRCCTTCRIFNWDHMMMFTPMLFVNSFFSVTLIAMAFAVWLVWELSVMLHPERFWEQTNQALRCSQCTDKLCTQFCSRQRFTKK